MPHITREEESISYDFNPFLASCQPAPKLQVGILFLPFITPLGPVCGGTSVGSQWGRPSNEPWPRCEHQRLQNWYRSDMKDFWVESKRIFGREKFAGRLQRVLPPIPGEPMTNDIGWPGQSLNALHSNAWLAKELNTDQTNPICVLLLFLDAEKTRLSYFSRKKVISFSLFFCATNFNSFLKRKKLRRPVWQYFPIISDSDVKKELWLWEEDKKGFSSLSLSLSQTLSMVEPGCLERFLDGFSTKVEEAKS